MLRRNIGKAVIGGLVLTVWLSIVIWSFLPAQPALAAGVLAKTVTKMFPTANRIGFHLVVTDDDRPDLGPGAQIVISKTYSANVPPGDMANAVRDELGSQAQKDIDAYKSLRARYDNATYDTKVAQIDGALTL
jgi:hypothetical protein